MVVNTKENEKEILDKEKHVMNTVNEKFNTSAVSLQLISWETLNWSEINQYVKNLRQRIFRAEQLGQKRKVRKLQRLMIKSKANLLLSIKRVTQINKGKRTAGVDGTKVVTANERVKLFNLLKDYNIKHIRPNPARRVYIPKKNGKLRPLGIPTIKDRIYQNIVKNALEPQWEAKFESISYGFRPKRSTHDAISNLFLKLSARSTRQWVFEGDFKGCFDNLNHQYIMDCIGDFPAKEAVSKWLKAGYVDNNTFNETNAGTPQGGIVSPLLANIALHGMEEELGVKYYHDPRNGYILGRQSVGTVKYADDFIIACKTKEEAISIYERLKPYLTKRGLTLAEDKTKTTHISEGFDFLGFNLRQYRTNKGMQLFIKPSTASVKKAKETIKEVFRKLRGKPVRELIMELNPIIRGLGNYWSSQVAKKVYANLDSYIWVKVRKHIKTLHPRKSFKWIHKRYFKPDYTGVSKAQWLLTDPHDNKTQLMKMHWIPIVRHVVVKYKNSPDDTSLKQYFEERDKREFLRFNILSRQKLAKKSNLKCRICKQSLVGEESLEVNHIVPRRLGGGEGYDNLELLHQSCYIQHHQLLEKYGEGKALPKIQDYFKKKQVEPNSKEGIRLMKEAFKKFSYQFV